MKALDVNAIPSFNLLGWLKGLWSRILLERNSALITAAQRFMLDLHEGARPWKDYRAPHANRPTPPRPRFVARPHKPLFRV